MEGQQSSRGGDEDSAVVEAKLTEGSFQLFNMLFINITQSDLQVLDTVDSHPVVHKFLRLDLNQQISVAAHTLLLNPTTWAS